MLFSVPNFMLNYINFLHIYYRLSLSFTQTIFNLLTDLKQAVHKLYTDYLLIFKAHSPIR